MGTIESILSFVKTQLKITSTDEDLGMLDLINETLRTFDCFETYVKKRCPLKREEQGWYCLPQDFYHELFVEGICNPFIGSNPSPNGITPQPVQPFIYYDNNFLCNGGTRGGYAGGYQSATVSINGNRLHVSGAFNGISAVVLTYEAYNTDEQGRFHAPVNFELAVAYRMLVEYAHFHRKNFAGDTIQYWEKRADGLYSQVRSASNIRAFRRNYAQIVDMANAIILDKNIEGYGW